MTASARDSPWSHSGAGSRGSHCLAFAVPARGQHTEKQQQLNLHKGFAEQEQTGYEGSLSCIRWWACNRAAFPTISDSNRVCAVLLYWNKADCLIKNTNSRALPDESERGCTQTCVSRGKEQFTLKKHARGLKHSWGKSPQKNTPKGNWEEKQKSSLLKRWKSIFCATPPKHL